MFCGYLDLSFGHASFFGVGGYITGILAFHAQNSEPFYFFTEFTDAHTHTDKHTDTDTERMCINCIMNALLPTTGLPMTHSHREGEGKKKSRTIEFNGLRYVSSKICAY